MRWERAVRQLGTVTAILAPYVYVPTLRTEDLRGLEVAEDRLALRDGRPPDNRADDLGLFQRERAPIVLRGLTNAVLICRVVADRGATPNACSMTTRRARLLPMYGPLRIDSQTPAVLPFDALEMALRTRARAKLAARLAGLIHRSGADSLA